MIDTKNGFTEPNSKNKKIIFDYTLLKDKIKNVCGSQMKFGLLMNWSDRTTTFKLNSKRYIKADEIVKAAEILGIAEDDIPKYFLKTIK